MWMLAVEPDRQEILKETELQENALNDIDQALNDMKRMGRVSISCHNLNHATAQHYNVVGQI